jgi:hypothetical protein
MSSADSAIAKAAGLLIIPTILSGGALLPLLMGLGLVWLLIHVAEDAERENGSKPADPPVAPPPPGVTGRRRIKPIHEDPDEVPDDPYTEGHHSGLGVSADAYAANQRSDD